MGTPRNMDSISSSSKEDGEGRQEDRLRVLPYLPQKWDLRERARFLLASYEPCDYLTQGSPGQQLSSQGPGLRGRGYRGPGCARGVSWAEGSADMTSPQQRWTA